MYPIFGFISEVTLEIEKNFVHNNTDNRIIFFILIKNNIYYKAF